MSILDEAIEVGKNAHTLHDGPTLKRIIAGLVQMIITERKDHAREIREIKEGLET